MTSCAAASLSTASPSRFRETDTSRFQGPKAPTPRISAVDVIENSSVSVARGENSSTTVVERYYPVENYQVIARRVKPNPKPLVIDEPGIVLQDWEGCVVNVNADTFTARLLDRTRNAKIDTEIAEIPLDEVDMGDRDLLRDGAIFYLTIRRRLTPTGRHEVGSQIVFRRLPAWHRSSLDRIEAEATKLSDFFADSRD